jgi:hypothetical protein
MTRINLWIDEQALGIGERLGKRNGTLYKEQKQENFKYTGVSS